MFTLDFGRIAKGMKLSFSVILDDPIDTALKSFKGSKFLNRYVKPDGSEFTTFTPHPYITIDISKTMDKGDTKNPNSKITLNLYAKMKLENELHRMLSYAYNQKNLFIMSTNNITILNKNLPEASREHVIFTSNKRCGLMYTVIHDTERNDFYEGIIFTINSSDNFCYLTMEEVELLLYTLKSIQMHSLVLNVLSYYESIKDTDEFKNTNNEIIIPQRIETEPIEEVQEVQEIGFKPVVKDADNSFGSLGI